MSNGNEDSNQIDAITTIV